MWKRKSMKRKAIALLKQNYWRMISVCFLIALLTTSYAVSTTFLNLQLPSGSESADAVFTLTIPNSEAVIDAVRNIAAGTPLPSLFNGFPEDALSVLIDLFSTTISVFFTWTQPSSHILGFQHITGLFLSDFCQQYPDHR